MRDADLELSFADADKTDVRRMSECHNDKCTGVKIDLGKRPGTRVGNRVQSEVGQVDGSEQLVATVQQRILGVDNRFVTREHHCGLDRRKPP